VTIDVIVLGNGDAAMLDNVAADVFDHDVQPERAAAFLADPMHRMVVAVDDGVVVGMLSAVTYQHPDKPLQLWINEVGVAPPYRRRGIGKRLVQRTLRLARELGCVSAWLGTEPDNVAANALYRSLDGDDAPFIMYSFELERESRD